MYRLILLHWFTLTVGFSLRMAAVFFSWSLPVFKFEEAKSLKSSGESKNEEMQ